MATHRKPPNGTNGTTTPPVEPPPAAPDDLFDAPTEKALTTERAEKGERALVPQVAEKDGTFIGDAKTGIARRGIYGDEIESSRESSIVGARVKAQIAARTAHALTHPRSFDDCRIAILRDCMRPEFAKAAIYAKPVGNGTVKGLSIRAAEAMLARWGNIDTNAETTYDDEHKRVVHISVSDLETNVTHGRDITIPKVTETLSLKPGQDALSQRVNSQGKITYTVRPTDDKLADIEASHRSKVLRNEGLRLIPPDIREEVMALCKKTTASGDAKDPDAARKEILDAFANDLSILPARLEEYLGCPPAECSKAQLAELREIYRAVRDGDATMKDFIEARVADISPTDGEEKVGSVNALKDAVKAKQAERDEKKAKENGGKKP